MTSDLGRRRLRRLREAGIKYHTHAGRQTPGTPPGGVTAKCQHTNREPNHNRGFELANIKSQIKRNRQNERRRQRNRAANSEVRTRTNSAVRAAEAGDADTEKLLRLAIKRIDTAAAKGMLHRNTAARKKSRLTRRIARIQAGKD